jgi:hypothetical protein
MTTTEEIVFPTDNCIYPNQCETFQKILQNAVENPYISLVAQMQSGKTDTFLLCAFEFLRLGMVDSVILFSGNADTELKKQTQESIAEFGFGKYSNYLQFVAGLGHMESQSIYIQNKPKIKVVWSGDLPKYTTTSQYTLFIWEESHFAQGKDMLPSHFLQSIQVPPTGNSDNALTNKQNYFLSVSATPFSEIANIVLQNQSKKIVYMPPPPSYRGVEYFMKHGMIMGHDNLADDLYEAIESAETRTQKHIYGVVRCYGALEQIFTHVATECGWDIQHYNLKTKNTIDRSIELSVEPPRNTLVFIKGALRMGKRVEKAHIGFVFESSESPNTDTVLQGLLGRMCSFDNVDHIRIYLHNRVMESGELEKYLQFIDSLQKDILPSFMPTLGMNMKRGDARLHKTRNNTFSTCPVYVPAKYITVSKGNPLEACLSAVFNDIDNPQYSEVVNYNSPQQKLEIRQLLIDSASTFSVHKLSKPSNLAKMPKLMHSFNTVTEFHSGSGNYSAIHLWVVDTEALYPSLHLGDVFIEIKTPTPSETPMNFTTTRDEVFWESRESIK